MAKPGYTVAEGRALVEARTDRLMAEFNEHYAEIQAIHGEHVDRDSTCCGWLIQKVSALQFVGEQHAAELQRISAFLKKQFP